MNELGQVGKPVAIAINKLSGSKLSMRWGRAATRRSKLNAVGWRYTTGRTDEVRHFMVFHYPVVG
jgi:hypothetical protein